MHNHQEYVNVKYNEKIERFNITLMGSLTDLKEKVHSIFGITRAVAYIKFKDKDGNCIDDLEDIQELYKKKIRNGGAALVIEVQPSPPVSIQGSHMDIDVDTIQHRWTTKTHFVSYEYNPSSPLFVINSKNMEGSGLPCDKQLVLFCREAFHNQFTFLREGVINNSRLGWILGPPGTGKSTTSFAFASTLDRNEWVVTWLHLSRTKFPVCLRFDGNTNLTAQVEDTSVKALKFLLGDADQKKKHFVFVDGYALDGPNHIQIQMTCNQWVESDRVKHRLVYVCSMSSRGKTKLEEDKMNWVKEHYVYSWTLQEYQLAVQQPGFFEGVQQYLDSSISSIHPSELVDSKYYFAGGSSRYMFNSATEQVIEALQMSIEAVGDIVPYIKGAIGDRSKAVINRLFSTYFNREYAATELAIKHGPDLIRNLAQALHMDRNPAMDGWLLEMWFFASLRKGGVNLIDKSSVTDCWGESDLVEFDPDNVPALLDDCIWLKPLKWNQGGYDAVFVDRGKKLVRFIQVTRGDTHSFKIQYFSKFFEKYRDSEHNFETITLEIYFLVQINKLRNFKILDSQVEGVGLLTAFDGWTKGQEKNQIKICGIEGLLN